MQRSRKNILRVGRKGCHLHFGSLVFGLLVLGEDPSPWMEQLLVDKDEEEVEHSRHGNDDR